MSTISYKDASEKAYNSIKKQVSNDIINKIKQK